MIALAVLTGLALRFVGLTWPPYDGHAFRQTQTLATIEFFYHDGIDILHPRTNCMGYPGTLVLELPLFQALMAALYRLFGPHMEIIRLINIFCGAGTAWLLFRAVELFLDKRTAILAALIYWLAPLNISYHRSTLLDPMAVFFSMLSFYCLALLIKNPQIAGSPESRPRYSWRCFAVFALSTWVAAMIKTLYLWPAVLQLGGAVLTGRLKVERQAIRLGIVFAIAGCSFFLWNLHAARVNAISPFTRGYRPTVNLGFSPLADPHYYLNMIVRRPKWWLGVLGALLYPLGLFAGWAQRRDLGRTAGFALIVLIPPSYLLLFPQINAPHDYYQLIITPFLAAVPANGLNWLASRSQDADSNASSSIRLAVASVCALFLIASPLSYLFWWHGGRPDPKILRFEQLSAGKVVSGQSALLFVANDCASSPPGSWLPEFLYAAHLWGYATMVTDESRARTYFEDLEPKFPKLEYLILYGTERPRWVPLQKFRLVNEEPGGKLFIFQRIREA
jgi:4-amino-4-deoxy-L-arabinose transferase-like glycosyltransferase